MASLTIQQMTIISQFMVFINHAYIFPDPLHVLLSILVKLNEI